MTVKINETSITNQEFTPRLTRLRAANIAASNNVTAKSTTTTTLFNQANISSTTTITICADKPIEEPFQEPFQEDEVDTMTSLVNDLT